MNIKDLKKQQAETAKNANANAKNENVIENANAKNENVIENAIKYQKEYEILKTYNKENLYKVLEKNYSSLQKFCENLEKNDNSVGGGGVIYNHDRINEDNVSIREIKNHTQKSKLKGSFEADTVVSFFNKGYFCLNKNNFIAFVKKHAGVENSEIVKCLLDE